MNTLYSLKENKESFSIMVYEDELFEVKTIQEAYNIVNALNHAWNEGYSKCLEDAIQSVKHHKITYLKTSFIA